MRIENSEIQLWVEEKPSEIPQQFLSVLSSHEQEELQKIPNTNRQLEYVMPRYMLRELLNNSYSEINYDSNGKPSIKKRLHNAQSINQLIGDDEGLPPALGYFFGVEETFSILISERL